jgi:hypothetical protein
MNSREKLLLKGWLKLKDKEKISFIDVVKIQPPILFIALACFLILGIYSYLTSGFYNPVTGMALVGIAAAFGYVSRTKKNWPIYRKYLNWEKIESV